MKDVNNGDASHVSSLEVEKVENHWSSYSHKKIWQNEFTMAVINRKLKDICTSTDIKILRNELDLELKGSTESREVVEGLPRNPRIVSMAFSAHEITKCTHF